MNLQTINDLTNDILVTRIEIISLEQQLEALMSTPEITVLQDQIQTLKTNKEAKQSELISIMAENNLKQWKTTEATFSCASRVSVKPNESYKKAVEKALKSGEIVDGWELSSTSYISIRTN